MDTGTIKLAAQVTSTLLGVIALAIGLRNEARNRKRFDVQIDQSRRADEAAAKPLLDGGRECSSHL
jgi:hypothetical protein